jgi:hypothetical protein
MFQSERGSGIELTTPKRYFRLGRTRAERIILRDKAMVILLDDHGWSAQDVSDAFGCHRDTVYESASSFRQLVREIAD